MCVAAGRVGRRRRGSRPRWQAGGQPAGGSMRQQLLLDAAALAPGIEPARGWPSAPRPAAGLLILERSAPCASCGANCGASLGISSIGQKASRAALTMAGAAALASTLPFQLRSRSAAWCSVLVVLQRAGGVVDGVGEPLRDDLVELGEDIVLQREHVGRRELVDQAQGSARSSLAALFCARSADWRASSTL